MSKTLDASARILSPAPELPYENDPSGRNPGVANGYRLNASKTVAVATEVFWNEDMTTCPPGAKVQLLGRGGIAVYGSYNGDDFWVKWAPVPRNRPK